MSRPDQVYKAINVVFFLACFSIVTWQTEKCFQKFLDEPQGTMVSVQKSSKFHPPSFTLCRGYSGSYNFTTLSKCNISSYFTKPYQWIGSGQDEMCTNPEYLYDNITYPVTDYVSHMNIITDNGTFVTVTAKKADWNSHDNGYSGRCFSLTVPNEVIEMGIKSITFVCKMGMTIYVHTPKAYRKFGKLFFEVVLYKQQTVKLEYEIDEMLPKKNSPCGLGSDYSYDECFDEKLYKETLEKIGCTTPFGNPKDQICTNASQGAEAMELFSLKENLQCSKPCLSYRIKGAVDKVMNLGFGVTQMGKLEFELSDEIMVISSFYVYDGLSMVAEIGGYVGLFMGLSFYQLSGVAAHIFNRIITF